MATNPAMTQRSDKLQRASTDRRQEAQAGMRLPAGPLLAEAQGRPGPPASRGHTRSLIPRSLITLTASVSSRCRSVDKIL